MRHARSLLGIALFLGLTLAMSPTALADEQEMAGTHTHADASWMFPKAKPGTYTGFTVMAIDDEPSKGPDVMSMAIVMSGPCTVDGNSTTCRGKHGGFYDLKPGQLQVAEDWSAAHLALGKKTERVDLTWTAEGIPLPSFGGGSGGGSGGPEGDYEYETDHFGIYRSATISGTMFGRAMGADGLDGKPSFSRGKYRGTYKSGDRQVRIGSVTWILPRA
jgi:hypothetical protein